MRIAATASAFPRHHYTQKQLANALLSHWADKLPDPRKLELLHSNVGVEGRFLALPLEAYADLTWGEANNAWIRNAEELGMTAICRALARAGLANSDLGAFYFVSVTGISSPSIDAHLINRMKLSPHIRRVPIFGLGCVAGAAGIARAADYVRAYPDQVAVLLSVELCSLTLQRDDFSIANLISTGLFGDGAAAVIIAGDEYDHDCELPGPKIVATQSVFYPDTLDLMGWDISEKGFKVVLSPEVPDVIARNVGRDADTLLAQHGLTRADIGCWILHTGGPKILRATQQALGIDEKALAASWDCLRRMGNLSSASVLMVLEETMSRRRPAPGTWSILGAMGPGFCSELVLLKW
jgi:alkylresorcinol/alkylpyrone synthase